MTTERRQAGRLVIARAALRHASCRIWTCLSLVILLGLSNPGVAPASKMEANRLKASKPLKVGEGLFIPGARTVKKVEVSRALTAKEREALERSLSEEVIRNGVPVNPEEHLPATIDDLVRNLSRKR